MGFNGEGQGTGQREPQLAACGLIEVGVGLWMDNGCIYITIV